MKCTHKVSLQISLLLPNTVWMFHDIVNVLSIVIHENIFLFLKRIKKKKEICRCVWVFFPFIVAFCMVVPSPYHLAKDKEVP